MPVYVDALMEHPAKPGLRWTRWCHMRADTLEELHAMASLVGLKREWFQGKPGSPHYDLTPIKRALAITWGAIPLNRREWVDKFPKPRRAA